MGRGAGHRRGRSLSAQIGAVPPVLEVYGDPAFVTSTRPGFIHALLNYSQPACASGSPSAYFEPMSGPFGAAFSS